MFARIMAVVLTVILLLMVVMHERVVRATEGSSTPVSRD